MISDARAAQIINSTMSLILVVLVLAFEIWIAITQFPRVHAIYIRLSDDEQRHLLAFLNSCWILLLFGSFAARWMLARLPRLKTPQASN